jgi:hypothetical protein
MTTKSGNISLLAVLLTVMKGFSGLVYKKKIIALILILSFF